MFPLFYGRGLLLSEYLKGVLVLVTGRCGNHVNLIVLRHMNRSRTLIKWGLLYNFIESNLV